MTTRRLLAPQRGAVEIRYDDTKEAFGCPHCGAEFFPDDTICISCGFEFADDRHPYHTPLCRPAPLLDATGTLDVADDTALRTALQVLRDQLGMEVLLAIMPADLNRPPEESAWYYANTWELGGVTSSKVWVLPPPPPTEPLQIIGAIVKEIALLPVNMVKGAGMAVVQLLHPPPAPNLPGLLIAVFPHWQAITLEPTIAAEGRFRWNDPALEAVLDEVAGATGDPLTITPALLRLLAALPTFHQTVQT
ncbi:MAG: hypothetical protein ABI743_00335 [bacterium]